MKQIKSIIFTILCLGFLNPTASLATSDENSTLHLTLTNHTSHTLFFKRVEKENPGNQFSANPATVAPGQTLMVTAEKQLNNDIFGQLIFSDEQGLEVPLVILDQRQFHAGQPIFQMHGNAYTSRLLSKTRNKNIGSLYLMYVEASITVEKAS